MFVETDVYTGSSLNAETVCAEFRDKCPDGLIVTDISGCIFCGFDEIISGLADICLCGSEIAMGIPPGLGMAVMNERAHTRLLAHNIYNGRYFNYPRRTVSRSASSLEAPPYPLLAALNEQIDTVLTESMPARVQRLSVVRNYIYEWANFRSFPIQASPEQRALNSTAFELPADLPVTEMTEYAARYGIFISGGVSQMAENSLILYHGNDTKPADASALIRVLDRFLNDYDTRRRSVPVWERPQEQKV